MCDFLDTVSKKVFWLGLQKAICHPKRQTDLICQPLLTPPRLVRVLFLHVVDGLMCSHCQYTGLFPRAYCKCPEITVQHGNLGKPRCYDSLLH